MRSGVWLIVPDGRGERRAVEIQSGKQTIGRGKKCAIRLGHISVSREHAEIIEEGNGLFIRDLGSLNGTCVDGERIDKKRRRIAVGQMLQIGDVKIGIADASSRIVSALLAAEELSTGIETPSASPATNLPAEPLTAAQERVLRLLLRGKSEKEIAGELSISPHTVHGHIKRIYRAYDVTSRGELMARFVGGSGRLAFPGPGGAPSDRGE